MGLERARLKMRRPPTEPVSIARHESKLDDRNGEDRMGRLIKLAAVSALTAAFVAPSAIAADDRDVIEYRQHVMNTIGEQAQAIAMIAENRAPADNVAVHAETLALAASTALLAFTPNVPGGKSKPEIWAKWDEFSKHMTDFAAKTDELAKLAKSGGLAAMKPKLRSTLNCRGCHDAFRGEKR